MKRCDKSARNEVKMPYISCTGSGLELLSTAVVNFNSIIYIYIQKYNGANYQKTVHSKKFLIIKI